MNLEQLIDDLFDKPQEKRNYLGASAVGNSCKRAVQYYWLSILGRTPTKDFPPRIKRIFDRGYVYEGKMSQWMKEVGFVFEEDDTKLQFSDFDDKFKGHVDGVLLAGPEGINYPVLWENKCLGGNPFKKVAASNIKTEKPVYYAQVQLYMSYLGLNRCVFTCVNADTMAIYTEIIGRDDRFVDTLKQTISDIFDHTERNKLVAKTTNTYHCKYCDYKEICT